MRTLFCLVLCLTTSVFAQKWEGLALTPPMGWNSWNTFYNHIDEKVVRETAEAMIANGMRDAGYTYIVIDDTWSLRERGADGNIVPDPQKFPSGLKALGDFLHSKGFKFGIYSCAGMKTCGGYPGSWGHEFQDARLFASWGVDYLKYDWCDHGTADARDAYKRMSEALRAAGRPVVFSLCEWGQNKPWEWAEPIGHLWRTTGDIYDSYDGRKGWESGWKLLLNQQYDLVPATGPDGLAKYAGPGHWNDLDMVAPNFPASGWTLADLHNQLSVWAMEASPLLISADIGALPPAALAALKNSHMIAIDQSGEQCSTVIMNADIEALMKPHPEGGIAVLFVNLGTDTSTGRFALSDFGITSARASGAGSPCTSRSGTCASR